MNFHASAQPCHSVPARHVEPAHVGQGMASAHPLKPLAGGTATVALGCGVRRHRVRHDVGRGFLACALRNPTRQWACGPLQRGTGRGQNAISAIGIPGFNWRGWVVAGVVCFMHAVALAAPPSVQVEEQKQGDKAFVLLRSAAFEALIAPGNGGQVVSLVHRPSGTQMGNTGAHDVGLFSEHDMKQAHPGELMHAAYAAKVLPVSPDGVAGIELSYLARGGWRNEALPSMKDVEFQKKITLDPLFPVVTMAARITNRSQEDKLVDYWAQNIARIGDSGERNYYYRPSPRGVSVVSNDYILGRNYVQDPTAGWLGVLNRGRGLGLVYLVDYAPLRRLYTCNTAYTQEFMYRRLPLPPGKSWETTICLRAVEGFKGFTHASARLVADVQVEENNGRLKVRHTLCAFGAPLTAVRVLTALRDTEMNQEVAGPVLTLGQLGAETVTRDVEFDLAAGGVHVVNVTVLSAAGQDVYEKPLSFFGDLTGSYSQSPPPHRIVFQKPDDLAAVWQKAKTVPAGLLQLGDLTQTDRWALPAIAKSAGMPFLLAKYQGGSDWRDSSFHPFPSSHAELFRYDVIVLATGDALGLGDFGSELVKDYVAQGGGLLFLGGYYSFGKGQVGNSPLADLCPVKPQGVWDLHQAANPVPQLLAGALPVFATLPWGDKPLVRWYQDVTAQPGAVTHLQLDNRPLLVTATRGKGRVAAFTGTVLGADPVPPAIVLEKWSGYPAMMQGLVEWLRGT